MDYLSSLRDMRKRILGSGPTAENLAEAYTALKRDREALELEVRELSRHSQEVELFGQLAEMLQACVSTKELCSIIAIFAQDLFPDDAGAIYLHDPERQVLQCMASWGDPGPAPCADFHPEDCWSIRRGKPYYKEAPHEDIYCAHVESPLPAHIFCLPLMGQESVLGLLHLQAGSSGNLISEARRFVAIALAYQATLGLSNLKLKETLREEAIHDPVTGLFNRRFMKESLDREIASAERNSTSLAVIAFDLDHFKDVNDTLGHAAGDSLLQGLAKLTKHSLRKTDICCRQGGDEFLSILPDIKEDDALALAEDLRMQADRFTREHFPSLAGKVTVSAGVALFPQDASSSESLQKTVDRALYRAKELGRNQVFAASRLESVPHPV
jgi:diguanylate cyclase (GGDEF)-like protein